MDTGLDVSTLEVVLALAFGALVWFAKDKIAELERKDLALTHKLVEMAEDIAWLKATVEHQQREIDRLGK